MFSGIRRWHLGYPSGKVGERKTGRKGRRRVDGGRGHRGRRPEIGRNAAVCFADSSAWWRALAAKCLSGGQARRRGLGSTTPIKDLAPTNWFVGTDAARHDATSLEERIRDIAVDLSLDRWVVTAVRPSITSTAQISTPCRRVDNDDLFANPIPDRRRRPGGQRGGNKRGTNVTAASRLATGGLNKTVDADDVREGSRRPWHASISVIYICTNQLMKRCLRKHKKVMDGSRRSVLCPKFTHYRVK